MIIRLLVIASFVFTVNTANAGDPACEDGGPCTCGELYNLDRCSGIGGNTCGCASGFEGMSLGETSDCGFHVGGGCCLPTGATYSSVCQGRIDGAPCSSPSQCESGGCAGGVCGPGTAAAPAMSTAAQAALLTALLFAGMWILRRTARSRPAQRS